MSDAAIKAVLAKVDGMRSQAARWEAEADHLFLAAVDLRREADRIEAAAREGGG